MINETILHKLNTDHPLKTEYQIIFLKHLIQELEKNTEEIHDLIFESLAEKVKQETSEFSYKHFLLDDQSNAITIKESNSFVSKGTTGLKLWPAAMALGDLILQNKEKFQGKSVLEIGSGATGFVGMILTKTCDPERVILSDCHESVIQTLTENVNLNFLGKNVEELEKSLIFRQRLKVENKVEFGVVELPWEDIDKSEEELVNLCKPNVLLAADVVYDETIFEALLKCVIKLFDLFPSLTFFLSQTIRNESTFSKFCNLLHINSFEFTEEPLKTQTISNVSLDEIKILRISKLAQ